MSEQKSVGDIMRRLSETDEPCAAAGAMVERLKFHVKRVKAQAFLDSAGTVAERDSLSEVHPMYVEACEKLSNAHHEYKSLCNERHTLDTRFKAWQSLNANRRG